MAAVAGVVHHPVLFGLGWLRVQGLNLGLDFESGTRIAITYDRPTDENGIRDVLAANGVNDAKVQATTRPSTDAT